MVRRVGEYIELIAVVMTTAITAFMVIGAWAGMLPVWYSALFSILSMGTGALPFVLRNREIKQLVQLGYTKEYAKRLYEYNFILFRI